MLNRSPSRLLITLILLSLSCFAFAQQNVDEQALRAIVARYFETLVKKDLDAFTSLWSERSPMVASQRQLLQRAFVKSNYRYIEPVISRIKIEGDKASVRIATERTNYDPEMKYFSKSQMKLDLFFVREDSEWKLWMESPAVTSLLNSLSEAKTDPERETILTNDPDNVTHELLYLLNSQNDRAFSQGSYGRALSLLHSARLVAERLADKKEVANAWQNIGIIHFVQKRHQQALEAYQKGLTVNEELGRRSEAARLLTSIGLVHSVMGQQQVALDIFYRGLKIHEDLREAGDIAQTLENIGTLHHEQGNYALASEFYQKVVKIYEAIGAKAAVASRLLKVARTEYELGNDEAAIGFYLQSLAKLEEIGDKNSRSYALHSIANIYYSQGDYPQALNYYQMSMKAEEEAGSKEGTGNALQGIGLVHSLNGNHALAFEAYSKNLSIAQWIGKKNEIAAAFQKVGGAHYSLGDYAKALEAYQKALALREEIGDQQEIAGAMLDLGITYASLGEFSKALEHYQGAKEKFEAENNMSGVAGALLNTSVVYYVQSDFAKTLEIAGQAADAAKQGIDMDLFWQARHRAGKAHYRLEQLDAAKQAFTEAITTIESKLSTLGRTTQPRFYENKLAPYLGMVDVLIGQNRGSEAFNFAERARARVLLGVLRSGKVWINKTMSPQQQERERQHLTEIALLSTQIYRENEREKPNRARITDLHTRLSKTRLDYESFKTRLYRQRPMLKVMRGEGKPLTAAQAAALLTDSKSVVLNFTETDEQVYLFAFTKNQRAAASARPGKSQSRQAAQLTPDLKIYVLNTNRAELDGRISAFQQLIANRSADIQPIARELYDLLLKPAEEQLAGKSQLIIVPDGVLWNLPFQALQAQDGVYLIGDYAVSYVPSLTAYGSILSLRNRPRAGIDDNLELLAFGRPALSQESAERIKGMLLTEQLNQLPEKQVEVEALSKLYDEGRSQVFTGADAREDRFKALSGKYRVLHLATRGVLNDGSPLFSPVALSPSEDLKIDGLLEARELLGLDLRAELAVISASELVSKRAGAGRAMTGLTWSFFIAGCPSTLVSQWQAESPATTELMLEFHRNLRASQQSQKLPKAKSWQIAVKQLLSREEYRHPYFWAGFELLGNGQ